MAMPISSLSREAMPWRAPLPVPLDVKWNDVWLTVTPIWAVLVACRVVFYELERLRLPDDVPPVVADAIQGIVLYPLVLLGCYATLRVWHRSGFVRAALLTGVAALLFGLLAPPAYAVGSLINFEDSQARQWLGSFGLIATKPQSLLYGWLSATVEYGVLYLSCVAVMIGYFSYIALRRQWRMHDQLAAAAGQARLRVLRAQVNPHFLFNSLNSIVCLSEAHPTTQLLVTQLSDLLRRTLKASELEEIELFEELSYLEEYLDIELTRQPNRIDWRITVDPGCARAAVPSLILMPIVENAVTHGLRGGARTVALDINVWRARHQLFIRVDNTCSDRLPVRDTTRPGLGLRNVRARLDLLFGEEATFSAGRSDAGRFRVQICLPVRELRTKASHEDSSCAS